MKLRRAGFGAGVDYDHGVVFGFRQIQFEAPRLARGDIGFDVGSEPVGIVAVVGENRRLLIEVIDVGVDRILRRHSVFDVMHDRVIGMCGSGAHEQTGPAQKHREQHRRA